MIPKHLLPALFLFILSTEVKSQTINDILPHFILTEPGVSLAITHNHVSSLSNVKHFYLVQTYNGIPVKNGVGSIHFDGQGNVLSKNATFLSPIASNIIGGNTLGDRNASVLSAYDKLKIPINDTLGLFDHYKINNYENVDIDNLKRSKENPMVLNYVLDSLGNLRLCWLFLVEDSQDHNMYDVALDVDENKIIFIQNLTVACFHDQLHNNTKEQSPCTCIDEKCEDIKTNSLSSKSIDLEQKAESMSLMSSGQYFIYPLGVESPIHGSRVTILNPQDSTASPYGWHDTNGAYGAEQSNTSGNNVLVREDLNADNESTLGLSPESSPILNFTFPYNPFESNPVENQNASLTNLFAWNNFMHDITYRNGFTEAAGNFQQNNYGRGGIANDHVFADGLDVSGFNNANFSTPIDGYNPRMQIYLFEAILGTLTVHIPSGNPASGGYFPNPAQYGPQIFDVTAPLQVITPNGVQELACDSLFTYSFSGKIVMIERGTCDFAYKSYVAQKYGAVGVLICQTDASPPFNMSGGALASKINIPSMMLSKQNCDLIKANKNSIANINIKRIANTYIDAGFDNGILAHEYAHGVTNRLTGGAANVNCLSNKEQMGEGWSDFFGLIMTMKSSDTINQPRGLAAFSLAQPPSGTGIRTYPYTYDMTLNPYTYNSIKQFQSTNGLIDPHGVGTVWCAMLWDLNWEFIKVYGFNNNRYTGNGGNNKVLALVMEALMLQPCSPGFIDARNAILLADSLLFNGQHKCLIWNAFAKRGLGYSASQGSSLSALDGIEAFDIPPSCETSVVNYENSGRGSLSYVLDRALENDTIKFATYLTSRDIAPQNSNLTINKNLVFNGNNRAISLFSLTHPMRINVNPNKNLELKDIKLKTALQEENAFILNNGTTILNNSSFIIPSSTPGSRQLMTNNGNLLIKKQHTVIKQ